MSDQATTSNPSRLRRRLDASAINRVHSTHGESTGKRAEMTSNRVDALIKTIFNYALDNIGPEWLASITSSCVSPRPA